ncbi:hypothetical protein H6P81_008934 [Aristolochia fimbriata]|uniref:Protein AAR2 homolog n=1 Tax=Aristolochia fimbriata TaxID=158543 RepID=A0AAV7EK36_ARIFI|nr:hypothetical protein H6P81_008934 [Aristolochia fimbriata]
MEGESEKPSPTFNLKLDPEAAGELVKRGSTLLLLDVPQFTLMGIDTQMFSVGPIFKGIKMIPPGPHFVYYSSSDKDGSEFSPIIGFFIVSNPAEVIVRKWHQQEERLVKLSEDEEKRYGEAVTNLEFDRQLGPYPLEHYGEWKRLSNYLSKETIERIEPIGGDISVACETELVDSCPKTTMEKRLTEQLKHSKFSARSKPIEKHKRRGCYYTTVPNTIKQKGISGEELTSMNLDKTQLLETILMKNFGGQEDLILGELQFAFIAFLMGQSLEAFLQWKALVSLLFSCIQAPLHTRSQLFTKFIKVIYYQIKHGFHKDRGEPIGLKKGTSVFLEESWLSDDIFLRRLCKEYFSLILEATVVDGDLLSWTRKLRDLLETTLGWDFRNSTADDIYGEDDEFAPVVEDMMEE